MDTGTVTFLFTDIEGSTRLWEQHPTAMKVVLARHDDLLRRAVEANQGRVVKTTGDGCHAAFEAAGGALAAALAAQRALAADPWVEISPQALRVRMGVHSGEADARAGDYFGPALNRAARLMSVGHGGQVLVSTATAELVRDNLPDGTRLVDLGEHRLKDLVRPEHIFQLANPLLPTSFPALKTLDAYPNNLPVQLTSFIGRERELDEAKQLFATARLVTFTGSGGTGKTRLALQAAAEMLPAFADGAWLVELASVTDGSQVLAAVAAALEMVTVPGAPLLSSVTEYLRGKRLLLIMDNCEHLIEACAQLAEHLLRACPQLKILASSREGLGIAGEISFRVPSLTLPTVEETAPEKVSRSEAAQLFMDRAYAANPRFTFTTENAAAIGQICRRLDGIPLALELAAARARLFPAEQIAERLNDRFRLLTGGSRTALPRQQTLRAMIDWSYDLLSEPERALLRRLSVFSGGWTFEAAEAVCADLDVLSLLELLVNKSLVVMEDLQGQARYHLLETIRQYARDKLIEAGEGNTLRDRHFDFFLRLSEQVEIELRGDQAFEWYDRLVLDEDNFRAAVEWGKEGRPEDALLLLGNLQFFWGWRGRDPRQVLQWLNDLQARLEGQTGAGPEDRRRLRAKARGFSTAGLTTMGLGDTLAAIAAFDQAIRLERELGEPIYLAYSLGVRATQAMMIGDLAGARPAAEEAAALARQMGDKRWLVVSLPILSSIEDRLGHHDEAARLRQEVRRYLDHVNHPVFIASLLGLGIDANYRGQLDEARTYYQEGLRIAQQHKFRYFQTVMESELAHLARKSGQLQQAKAAYRKLIIKWKEYGQVSAVAHQMECFAMIALEEGQPERAARLFGTAEAIRERINIRHRGIEIEEYEQAVTTLRGQMDGDAYASAWEEGRAMDLDRAVHYAIAPAAEGLAAGVK